MALERILVVGKEQRTHDLARPYTRQLFAADDARDLWQILDSVDPHLILVDTNIGHDQVRDLLQRRKQENTAPVVVVDHEAVCPQPETLLDLGALDVISGLDDHPRLAEIVDRVSKSQTGNDEVDRSFFAEDCPSCVSIVGRSPATEKALRMIRLVASSSCNPVLIVGETGTGKELAARAVHILRHGADKKFVAVNCAALTANLLESELFGHVKGSFTSAEREKTGLLEVAGSGSIFLDEISEMPLDLQAKLLRVLQEKTFRKVGGIKDIACKATIIASSNRNLMQEVENGRFRRDLYYRLSICPVYLAPLRHESRRDDILLLAEYFIRNSEICPEKKGKIKGLTKLAAEGLGKHHWPGNVRELKNVIERAILLEASDKIGLANLIINPDEFHCADSTPAITTIKDFSLERAEKELVAKALAEAGWQKTRAAALLGITRATLYAKVKQYNIQEPQRNPDAVTV
ncbi:MAG TPA: sigma-54 dependent transcriptional regulator [Anaerohalosphaeraceae bacterium]|nr:sigma-54 dependent transcriptional regulator [Anaerohalosphaeraceae bacterium]HRT49475.1 sigma-54 dependent transcriptional regulator [Anaerohalosphaeraceae bacterium]HRT85361.1 sigma-54 dependent transcriptional regulator [Anaerohalosphaeraceae bacterium]